MDFDGTRNLFIEAENLEALKILQKAYAGSVKMIYIDPPYNTGSDSFIYPDKFSETREEYAKRVGDKDSDGYLKRDGVFQGAWRKNPRENGHYHSNWLSMMLPRLHLARTLLRDDGVIFISIDDNEQAQLKLLCDEVFGAENFVNIISVNIKNIAGASGGGEDKRLKKNIENLIIYTKNYDIFSGFKNVYDYFEISELVKQYKEEERSWKYTSVLVEPGKANYLCSTTDGDGNEIKIYRRDGAKILSVGELAKQNGLTEEEVYSKYSKSIFQTAMPQSSIRPRVMKAVENLGIKHDLFSIEYVPKTGRNKGQMYEQFYKGENFRLFAWLKDVTEEVNGKLFKKELQGTYWNFASDTKNLTKEGNVPFPNAKKPLALLNKILNLQDSKDFIAMDFFAGSGTTAHAVMQLNAEDGGNRRYLCVQLPEETEEKSEARKAGFENIAEIAKERIRRAGKQVSDGLKDGQRVDTGFKVFKLAESNFKQWRQPENIADLGTTMEMFVNAVQDNATPENMVYELMLRLGCKLTSTVEHKNGVYWVTDEDTGKRIALLLEAANQALIDEVIAAAPAKVVALDKWFDGNDALKSNTVLQMKDAGIVFECV